MLNIFIGYDPRQPVSFTALVQSIMQHATRPISITPLIIETLPLKRAGLTPFTFTRFLVPHLMNYQGWGLFLDIDIMLRDDINALYNLRDESKAVMVSKNEKRFEWASVMLFNSAHRANRVLTPQHIEVAKNLHGISWLVEPEIGALPGEWNHLVGYDAPNPNAKLVHFTQGVPAYEETQDSEFAAEWKEHIRMSISSAPWAQLMGPSVHAVNINGRPMPRYKIEGPHANTA